MKEISKYKERKLRLSELNKLGITKQEKRNFTYWANKVSYFYPHNLKYYECSPQEHWNRSSFTTQEMYDKYLKYKDGIKFFVVWDKVNTEYPSYIYAKNRSEAKQSYYFDVGIWNVEYIDIRCNEIL